MKTIKSTQQYIGFGKKEDRSKNDFYRTPLKAIDALLDRETFEGLIWEPACGDGAIAQRLIERGYKIRATDLGDYGYGEGGIDFLNESSKVPNIITNPPFSLGTKFAIRALKLATKKIAFLNKLTFLEGKERRDMLFSQRNLQTVYVFGERVSFQRFGEKSTGGMMAFAWFVWDKSYNGDPIIKWI